MATYTWSIANLERNTADGGVTIAHWRCEGVDGDNSTGAYGTTSFTPDPQADDFIAFDALTEADVLGWVHAEVSKDDTEASLQAQLDEMANPTTDVGMPWTAEA
jgi:hypothetical protein